MKTISLQQSKRKNNIRNSNLNHRETNMWYYIFLIPAVLYFLVFRYIPIGGLIIAFKDYEITTGVLGFFSGDWVGLKHFRSLFSSSLFLRALRNTIILGGYHVTICFSAPIVLSILLNELKSHKLKKIIQSSIYIPHFISWAVIGGVVYAMLSPSSGVINYIFESLNLPAQDLLTNNKTFRGLLVGSKIWKEAGWGTIIYLATITGINPELYEAAMIDGAGRFKRILHITLPGVSNTIFVLFIIQIGNILNAGMLQVLAMYNPLVYEVSEITDTFIYKTGLLSQRFSYTTAAGMFNSVVGLCLILIANKIKKKMTGKGVW